MSDEIEFEESSGNVFADLGHPDPDTALVKAELARRITELIEHRELSLARAAEVLGLDQPTVSALIRGRLRDFSTERLMGFLTRLDQDIVIRVVPKAVSDRPARIAVSSGA